MRKYVTLAAIAALTLGAQSVVAAEFSYNLVEGSYISPEDGDGGFGIAGSIAFNPNVFGLASVSTLDFGPVDVSWMLAGVGYNRALSPVLDFVGTATLERVDPDGASGETGFGIGAGLRGKVMENLELHGGLKYLDISDYEDTRFSFGGRYYFAPNFAGGLDVSDDDFGTTWTLSLRYDFGKTR